MILTCTFRNTFHLVISGSVLHIFSNLEILLFNSKSHILGVFFFFFPYLDKIPQFSLFPPCTAAEQKKPVKTYVWLSLYTLLTTFQIGKKVVSVLKNSLLDAFFFKKTSPLCKGSEFCKKHSLKSVRMIKNCIYIK